MSAFVRYLTPEEQRRLVGVLRLHRGNPAALRDLGWVSALLHTGMRLGEWSAMTVGDALEALRTGWIFIPADRRKGREGQRRDHTVLVTVPVRKALQMLLRARVEMLGAGPARDTAPLVVSRHGGAMCMRQYQVRLAHWAKLAELPDRVSPHWLRHTRAKNIMRATTSNDPRGIVQAALGHASIASTGIYTEVSREDLAAALAEVDGEGDRRAVKRGLKKGFERRAAA